MHRSPFFFTYSSLQQATARLPLRFLSLVTAMMLISGLGLDIGLGRLHAAVSVPLSPARITASSSQEMFGAQGAADGNRFSAEAGHAWKSAVDDGQPVCTVRFDHPQRVGAVLWVVGTHDFVFTNAPSELHWEATVDGRQWNEIRGSRARANGRLFRIQRFHESVKVLGLRMVVDQVEGGYTMVRELEFYESPRSIIAFPEWIVAVNATHESTLPGHGQEFIPLARRVIAARSPHAFLPAQQIWMPTFRRSWMEVEPQPLCAFISGSFKDWCEVNPCDWRGVGELLRSRQFPMWASCGGAQGMALVSEYGTRGRWDCPHCRVPGKERRPVYGHIGHTAARPCGDYDGCIFERGPHTIRKLQDVPALAGVSELFEAMESHCGQIERVPRHWSLVAEGGPGTMTHVQCIQWRNSPIYAAQFHIEMMGTPASSAAIMEGFLQEARAWKSFRRSQHTESMP